MGDFAQQIASFQSNGAYNYHFDSAGNEILNPSSSVFQENYLAFPTVYYVYDESKIVSFYDTKFTEFIPVVESGSTPPLPQDIIDQINEITQNNQILQNQLDAMISESEIDSTAANAQAVKDIIINLRIQIGQGANESDFRDNFPYLPIPIDQRDL